MPIYLGSRYEKMPVKFFTFNPNRDPGPVVYYEFSSVPTSKMNYSVYQWKTGDRIESLAAQFYSYPTKWWIIADHNPQISDWLNVPIGTEIRIPRA
jgi:hypothetical protein